MNFLFDAFPAEMEARETDIAILPIGSLEQHGPHLPLGTDGYAAEALAQEVGRLTGGMVLPAIPFSWVGCTNAFSGGIGVREEVFLNYLRAVVKTLWQTGFRRILVLNMHGGNFYAMRRFPNDLFREERIPVLCTFGEANSPEAHEIFARVGDGEGTPLTGALILLGKDELLAEVTRNTHRAIAEFGDNPAVRLEPASGRDARRLGVVGHDYSHECLHVQPDSRFNPEAGAEGLRRAAGHIAAVMNDFRDYVQQLEKAGHLTS